MSAVLRWLRHAAAPMLVARLVLGGVYVAYGIAKVLDPVSFLKALHGYAMLPVSPPYWLNVTVVVLPWVEILGGLLLLLGGWVRAASALLLLLTVVFTVAVTVHGLALAAAGQLPPCAVRFYCGCGTGEVWLCNKVAENVGLTALAVIAVASSSRRWALDARRR